MASQGRERRGRPRGASQAPPVFDQQAFDEAVGVTAATIVHASVAGSQGGPSNLLRFRSHHPPTFIGEGIRWWQIIGSETLRMYWRLWILPYMQQRSS